ncbi:Uncharacterized protein Rs2_15761 [Raphanus sativus]|nr:Uncharacterized protein Rs2_15761 [Raphanus sativus]
MVRYNIGTTRKLVAATMALHNFVRKSSTHDPDFDVDWREDNDQQPAMNDDDETVLEEETDSRQYMEGCNGFMEYSVALHFSASSRDIKLIFLESFFFTLSSSHLFTVKGRG